MDTCVNEEYLTERFRLFEKFTWATMLNQTYKNFTWLVLFSDRTPTRFKEKITVYCQKMKNFKPIFLTAEEAANISLAISPHLTKGPCEYLVTTRLDNDDAVSEHFMEDIAKCVVDNQIKHECFLYFRTGIQYNERENAATIYEYPDNHFTSLVMPYTDENLVTILSYDHKDTEKRKNSISIPARDKYTWAEILHSSNYGNITHQALRNYIKDPGELSAFKGIKFSWTNAEIKRNSMWLLIEPIHRVIIVLRRHGIKESYKRVANKMINRERNGHK